MAKPMTVSEMASLGGIAGSARLTPEQRTERARNAAKARWKKAGKKAKKQK
jgi:hypothetical protein